jgi:sugar lactone lactonase YvrE
MRMVRGAGCLALVALLGVGCDDDGGTGMGRDGGGTDMGGTPDTGGSPDGGGADTGGGDGGPSGCMATTTTGSLTVTISGLPATVPAAVTVTPGTGSPMMVTATQTLMVPGGTYSISARRVAGAADPIVRQAFEPTIGGPASGLCVRTGMTTSVTVSYALIASSNKLWLSNGNAMAAMLGYQPADLAATGMPAATVAAKTESSAGFTFDAAGNLWALGSTTADAPIARYAAATLGASGTKVPDVELSGATFGGGSPGAKALAFDKNGNLWSTVVWADKVVRFTPAQIAASGAPVAAVEMSGVNGPGGLAFDKDGNLWVTSDEKVLRINAARLSASGTGADLTITMQRPLTDPATGPIGAGHGLAFDKDGNLWVEAGSILCKIAAADLAGTGPKDVVPAVRLTMTVTGLPAGLAFDEGGGLWIASSNGKFGRYTAAQLAATADANPSVIITSADVGYADYFAVYPAPAGLPLYHSLP